MEISVDDIQTVLNLRDGWKFIINSVDEPLILEFNIALNNWYLKNELQPLKKCLRKCIKTLEI